MEEKLEIDMQLNFQQLTDNELVNRYQHSECEIAIRELVYRHKDRVYSNIFYIIKDSYIAEDILQETLVKVAGNIRKGKYVDQGKFAPWIARIAHNLCIDYIRKSKSTTAIPMVSNEVVNVELLGPKLRDFSSVLEAKETEGVVWQLIKSLPEEQMEVIIMRIYGEMSFKEISSLMGVSINTSLGRMRYALINLRKIIQEKQLVLR